jgi:hypothetical protein
MYMNTSQSEKYSVIKVLTIRQKMLHVHRNSFLSIFNFNNADNCNNFSFKLNGIYANDSSISSVVYLMTLPVIRPYNIQQFDS